LSISKLPPIQGQQFGSADELLSGVRKILDEISIYTLEAISENGSTDWTMHCNNAANGKYVE
jgi:hypothetical protein